MLENFIDRINNRLQKAEADLATFGNDVEAAENRIIDAEFAAHDMKQRAEAAEARVAELEKALDELTEWLFVSNDWNSITTPDAVVKACAARAALSTGAGEEKR